VTPRDRGESLPSGRMRGRSEVVYSLNADLAEAHRETILQAETVMEQRFASGQLTLGDLTSAWR
jgi:hypothetical protein